MGSRTHRNGAFTRPTPPPVPQRIAYRRIAVDIKYKTRKRKIRGGRRHRRRRKTTPWFDLNEFSSALLFLCLVCARSSCSLFFYSIFSALFFWVCEVSTPLQMWLYPSVPGGLNLGCVHLSSCHARAAALSSLSLPQLSYLPASSFHLLVHVDYPLSFL